MAIVVRFFYKMRCNISAASVLSIRNPVSNTRTGIVIYFANPYAQYEKLRDPVNSRFMNGAAQVRESHYIFLFYATVDLTPSCSFFLFIYARLVDWRSCFHPRSNGTN